MREGYEGRSFLIGEVRGGSICRGVGVVVLLFLECWLLASYVNLSVLCKGVQRGAGAILRGGVRTIGDVS